MPIEVEIPGVGIYEYPDGTSEQDIKTQQAEEAHESRYQAGFDEVKEDFSEGNYWDAAKTLFGDILPHTLGRSLPQMGAAVAGAAGAAALAPVAAVGASASAVAAAAATQGAAAIAGGTAASMPFFFGMNVERQIQEREITNPDDIEGGKALAAAALQGAAEVALFKVLKIIPGIDKVGSKGISDMVQEGATKLSTKRGLLEIGTYAAKGGATEAVTEVGQQMLERAKLLC